MSLLGISKKGKWIVGGVALFAVIATASTGLAAWVIGQNTNGSATGNINVSTVDDRSCNVTMTKGADLTVNFGPCQVTEGVTPEKHVISPSGTETEEDLKFTISGTLDAKGYGSVKVFIAETNILKFVETTEATPNYIVMPTEFAKVTGGWEATINVTTGGTEDDPTYSFSKEFSFTWGSKSEKKNTVNHFIDYDQASNYLKGLFALNEKSFDVTVTPVYGTTTNA